MVSDNPVGAENQQERLIGWVLGFVDGEGCFSVGFIRQHDRMGRRGYRSGFQVAHEFAVTQGVGSLSALQELQCFFGVGMLVPNRRYDNHREHLYRFVVRRRVDLVERVIPFFEANLLRTRKHADFEKFAQIVWMVDNGCHLTRGGLIEIAEIAQTMNRRKSRADLIRILRGHTPEVQDTGS